MTWAYRVGVLDLEPHGPLPSQIYWRRRGLALSVGVLVVAVVVAVVVFVMTGNTGAGTKNKPVANPAPAAVLPAPVWSGRWQVAGRSAPRAGPASDTYRD